MRQWAEIKEELLIDFLQLFQGRSWKVPWYFLSPLYSRVFPSISGDCEV